MPTRVGSIKITKFIRYFCLHCGKECWTWPSRFRQYCSIQCSTRHQMLHGFVTVWKGGRRQITDGRWVRMIYRPDSPRGKYQYEHIYLAEKALGKHLPPRALVHHFNEDHSDNSPGNLVICQDQSYHRLLHTRAAVYRAGGNPNTDKLCSRCAVPKAFIDFPQKLANWDKLYPYCRACLRIISKETHAKRMAKRRAV